MKVVIAGGNGFLGRSLEAYLQSNGEIVKVLCRNPKSGNDVAWDGKELGSWVSVLEAADVLINLVGKSVDCRYKNRNKEEILSSRIDSTNVLQRAVDSVKSPPKLWLNASSATIYIHAESQLMTEETGIIGDDFSMNICKAWEKEFFRINNSKTRKVALRSSIVLGNEGGAFPKIKLLSRLGLGGKIGNGQQKMSWMHIIDLCKAISFIIENQTLDGVINVTAPNPLTNEVFMKTLRQELKMPIGLPMPVALLEIGMLLVQSESELMLKSRNVYPEKLVNAGFKFIYADAQKAFEELCH